MLFENRRTCGRAPPKVRSDAIRNSGNGGTPCEVVQESVINNLGRLLSSGSDRDITEGNGGGGSNGTFGATEDSEMRLLDGELDKQPIGTCQSGGLRSAVCVGRTGNAI